MQQELAHFPNDIDKGRLPNHTLLSVGSDSEVNRSRARFRS
jgi:hypothetical protein